MDRELIARRWDAEYQRGRYELRALTREGFEPLVEPREDVIARVAPQTGSWAQWEGIWRRR